LLPIEYFHVVFTLPAEIARIALWNKRAIYGLLFRASAETVKTIAADPKRMGARVGMTSVLHTWGSALTHHPHIHMIVPGGGLSPGGTRWIASKPGFFLHVRVRPCENDEDAGPGFTQDEGERPVMVTLLRAAESW